MKVYYLAKIAFRDNARQPFLNNYNFVTPFWDSAVNAI
jgi:hypothetical protein